MAANNPLFDFSQPRVMAILNVTPDSFFAGSRMLRRMSSAACARP